MSKLYIITVATDPVCYFPYLKESIERNGGELIVLGFGEKWKGFGWKFSLVLEQLKKLNDYDIVCFVDGYDVICTRNLETIKNDFIKIRNREKCKLIVGHDKVIVDTILQKIIKRYTSVYYGKCNNLSVNSGTYIGYVKDVSSILKNIHELKNSNIEDDQILLTDYCNKNKNDIYIDFNSELFLTIINGFEELDRYVKFSDDKIIYKDTNPYFFHAAGEGYLDNIIIRLGYDMKDKVNKDIKKKMYKKVIKGIKDFFNRNRGFILLFVFVVIFFYLIYAKIK